MESERRCSGQKCTTEGKMFHFVSELPVSNMSGRQQKIKAGPSKTDGQPLNGQKRGVNTVQATNDASVKVETVKKKGVKARTSSAKAVKAKTESSRRVKAKEGAVQNGKLPVCIVFQCDCGICFPCVL